MKEGCGARCVTGCKEGSHHEDEALAGALVRGVQPAEHWALLPEVHVLDCCAPIIMMTRPAFLGSALSLYLKSFTLRESACVRASSISHGGHSRPVSQVWTTSSRHLLVVAHLEETRAI